MKALPTPRLIATLLSLAFSLSRSTPSRSGSGASPKRASNEKQIFRRSFDVSGAIKSAHPHRDLRQFARRPRSMAKQCSKTRPGNRRSAPTSRRNCAWGKTTCSSKGAMNQGSAALLASLVIETVDGKKQLVETGPDWKRPSRAAASSSRSSSSPNTAAVRGGKFWMVRRRKRLRAMRWPRAAAIAADPATIQVPAGFKVELLYTVPKADTRLVGRDHGRSERPADYMRSIRLALPRHPAKDRQRRTAQVEQLPADIQGAHGLLFAHDSLYVMVDEGKVPKPREQGLWRLEISRERRCV